MNAFNFAPESDIYVNTEDDNVTVRFNGDTFALNPTSSGFSVTNDWNNRHFTLGFDENSILYHVTRESEDDRMSGKQRMPPAEFVAELYVWVRSIALPIPKNEVPLDYVGRADVDEMQEYMIDKGVVTETKSGIEVDSDERTALVERLNRDQSALNEMFNRVLTPVPIEDATDPESGEHVYFFPTAGAILILVMFPDGYVGVTTASEVFAFDEVASGSQIMDHMLRSMDKE